MLDALRKRNNLLPFLVCTGGLLACTPLYPIHPGLFIMGMVLTAFFTYLELVTQMAFRTPTRRKEPVDDDDWTVHDIESDGVRMRVYLHQGLPSAPTLMMCHGWTAGSIRLVPRAQLFLKRGWSVILIDLPNHGSSGDLVKWTAEKSTTLIIDTNNMLQDSHPQCFENDLYFYGHSIGSFIGLRISKRRNELRLSADFRGWIFESPMTGYTEIFHETCRLLRIPHVLRPWVLRKTIRHVNAANKETPDLHRLYEADVPLWGMTHEPTLLVQAYPDERLGSSHYERLIALMGQAKDSHLTVELLEDLTHSGSHESAVRDAAIERWLSMLERHSSA